MNWKYYFISPLIHLFSVKTPLFLKFLLLEIKTLCYSKIQWNVKLQWNEFLHRQFLRLIQSTSAISNTHYLEISLFQTFYLVSSAFSLTSLINLLGILNCDISNFHYASNFLGPFSHFWIVFHPLSWTLEWGFRMNHTVHFRHSNVNNCIHITLSRSLFFLFFNIVLTTTCKNSMETV